MCRVKAGHQEGLPGSSEASRPILGQGHLSGPGRRWTGEGTRAIRRKPVLKGSRIENSGLPFPEMETGFIMRQIDEETWVSL